MVAALSLTNINPGFSTSNKAHKYYLEYGLWVDLRWTLLDETNLEWMAKSKVVLGYELKHTNKELNERLTCRRGAPGGFKRGEAGRPGPTSLGASLLLLAWFFSSPLMLALLLCDRVLHGVAPPKRSRPFLCLHYWSFHLTVLLWVTSMLPCLTCLHEIPAKQSLVFLPCLSFACGLIKDVGGASRDASWCMHG
jgi:hypothetical protein